VKKIKIVAFASACIATICATTSVFAVAPLPNGWYLEGNGGYSSINNGNYVSGSSISTTGIAWNLNGGYKFSPFFGGEVGYTRYSNSAAKVNAVKVAKATYYSYDIAGKGILPIGDSGFELFAKLGIARLNAKVSSTNSSYAIANGINVSTGTNASTGYYFGLGADYSFLPALALNGQWQRAKGNNKTGTQNLYSLGMSYLFG